MGGFRYPGRCPGLKKLKAFQAFGTSDFTCVTDFDGVTNFCWCYCFYNCPLPFQGSSVGGFRYPGRCPGLKRLKAFQAFGTSKFACVTGFYGVTKFDGVTVFDCVTDFDGVTVSRTSLSRRSRASANNVYICRMSTSQGGNSVRFSL